MTMANRRVVAIAALLLAGSATLQTAEAARRVVVVRTPHLRVVSTEVIVVEPGRGRLHVNVDPERARVYVDGRYAGRGDQNLVVRPGNHRVRVVLNNGNRSASETVRVEPGHLTRVKLDLD
jgi:hypothetical protein